MTEVEELVSLNPGKQNGKPMNPGHRFSMCAMNGKLPA